MVGSNLPPGVTPGDIDDHYGTRTDRQVVFADAEIGISADVPNNATNGEIRERLEESLKNGDIDEILDVEVVHMEKL